MNFQQNLKTIKHNQKTGQYIIQYDMQKSLPQDFAEQILDLELKMEDATIKHEDIISLVELYSQGIEFYEQVNVPKQKLFQKKFQKLMSQKNIIQSMNNHLQLEKEKKEEEQIFKFQQQQQQDQQKMGIKQYMENKESVQIQQKNEILIKNSVQQSLKVIGKIETLVQQDIENQQNDILKRLEKRKSVQQNRQFLNKIRHGKTQSMNISKFNDLDSIPQRLEKHNNI